jgi:hypothetical protein
MTILFFLLILLSISAACRQEEGTTSIISTGIISCETGQACTILGDLPLDMTLSQFKLHSFNSTTTNSNPLILQGPGYALWDAQTFYFDCCTGGCAVYLKETETDDVHVDAVARAAQAVISGAPSVAQTPSPTPTGVLTGSSSSSPTNIIRQSPSPVDSPLMIQPTPTGTRFAATPSPVNAPSPPISFKRPDLLYDDDVLEDDTLISAQNVKSNGGERVGTVALAAFSALAVALCTSL